MRSSRRRSLVLCSAVAGTYVGSLAIGSPISFAGGTYSQNFSALPIQVATFAAAQSGSFATGTAASSTGTGTFSFTTLSTPFDFDASNTSGGLGISQLAGFFGGASTNSQFGAQNGGTTKGGVIDFGMNGGVSTAGQRFLGVLDTSTTSPDSYFGLGLVNNTGSTINSFNLGFVAALWRQSNVGKTLYFGYETGAAGTAEPAPGSLTAGIGSVTFATAGSGAVAVDGTLVANQQTINDVVSIPGGIAAGSDLYLEWYFNDSTGSAQGIGISTLSFSVAASGTGGGSKIDTWTVGTGSGAWDIGTTRNFTSGGSATTYAEGDAVVFPDFGSAGTGTINVTAPSVSPSSIAVSNNTGTYTVIGNPINGTGALTKTGNGTLVLSPSTTNGYAGGTNINGGTIIIATDGALGASTGAVSLNGGALAITAPLTSARSLSFGTNGGTVAIGSNSVTYGAASGSGAFTQLGTGTLTFTGTFAAGPLLLTGGTIAFNGGVTSADKATATVNPGSGGGLNGNILLGSNVLFAVSGNTAASPTGVGSLSGTGSILVSASGATISNTGSQLSTIGTNIALNSSGIALQRGDVTDSNGQSGFVAGSFVTVIGGATKPAAGYTFGLNVNGVISGNSDVVISNDPITGAGSGTLYLNEPNTYTGTTIINMGAGKIVLGTATNALPATTDISIGGSAAGVDGLAGSTNTGTIGLCSMDMAGNNQAISSISDGDNYGPGQTDNATGSFVIINSSATTSTLTISGSTTPMNPNGINGFSAGRIGSGTASFNNIDLVKGGTNTITLNNTETYTGSTTVTGGTLSISSTQAETASTPIHGSIASTNIVVEGIDSPATLVLYNSTALSNGNATTVSVSTATNGASVALDFSGMQNLSSLVYNGATLPNGIYNSSNEPFLSGSGSFDVVPEPAATLTVLSVAVPAILRRRRRRQPERLQIIK